MSKDSLYILALEYAINMSRQNKEAGYLVTWHHMPELHRCKSETFEQVQRCTILDKVPWILVNHHFQISVATKTR
jgi:hypothetical protein